MQKLMKKYPCVRLVYADKWLVYRDDEWVAYQHKYRAKKSTILIKTQSQDKAVNILCDDSI